MRIGIDLMGSDSSPTVLFEAVLQATQQLESATLIVFASQSVIDYVWTPEVTYFLTHTKSRLEFHIVTETIEMNDDPLLAIRQKKNSSLMTGLRLLKKRCLDAFVSAGNTGALIAGATLSLPRLPGVKRPALLATLPTAKGHVVVVDVGGNVSYKAHHLVQFAYMGAAYQKCCYHINLPTLGLLNVGVESQKGTSEIRQTYQILQQAVYQNPAFMQFIGNIEGREVFQGKVDVLVTDGFTGNVLLKASEGVSQFILEQLQGVLKEFVPTQQSMIMEHLHQHFDYEEYSGAIVCGLERLVIKCHGQSSVKSLLNGIKGAVQLVKNHFIEKIKLQLNTIKEF